jgi:outer membrane protein TolC
LILSQQQAQSARASTLQARSALLPDLTAAITESAQQINLAVFGLPSLPGTPTIVGPFPIFDARASVAAPVLDFARLRNYRAQGENERAARLSITDARDVVVLAVTNLYLQAVAGLSRIDTAQAQLATAEALYKQAVDLRNAGVAAGIDVLRADVERQAQQQRVIYFRNEWEKQKLRLARAIGLPVEQQFRLTDRIPYSPPASMNLDQALTQSYTGRSDYQSALAAVRSAELSRSAAAAQRYPALDVSGNYGAIGRYVNNTHGTFTASAGVRFPIFDGGRISAALAEAQANLERQRSQAADLRERIAFEVRSAMLDLNASNDQVNVARQGVTLAEQQLTQARDRFTAGVANSLEVVQSQEAVASANDNYITALFGYNAAKAALARALGTAEKNFAQLLGVQ